MPSYPMKMPCSSLPNLGSERTKLANFSVSRVRRQGLGQSKFSAYNILFANQSGAINEQNF
jgi:hypothetical protein